MCGLLGFTGDHPADPGKLRVLYMINKSRGSDSTGLFGTRMMKKVGDAEILLKDPNFDSIATSRMVLGHTRQSTGTAKTKENAHPFSFGEKSDYFVVGTHNGSIFNEYEMEKKIDNFTRASVDSASIYKAIYQTKDIRKVVGMLEGHVALAFRINDLFYMYRRDSRPLFLGKTKEGWYYSSIKEALRLISIPEEKIYDVTPHRLLGFKGSRMVLREDMNKPRVEFDFSKTSYNWEYGLSPELKEELTGKKTFPVVITPIMNNLILTDTVSSTGVATEEKTKDHNLAGKDIAVQETRVISIQELKAPQMPRLYGKSILMPASKILSSHEYTSFLRDQMKRNTGVNVVYPNYFKSDQSIPFWVKSVSTIIASNIYMVPQKVGIREDCEKNQEINLAIKPMFYNEKTNIISLPFRQSLFMFVTLEEDMVGKNSSKRYFSEAVSYFPVVHDRKNTNNYINVNIPSFVCREIDTKVVRIRIAIADVRNKGFLWETSLSVEKGGDYGFTAVMDSVAEDKFAASFNIFKATKGESVSIDGFKESRIGFESESISNESSIDLKIALKGAMRAISSGIDLIPMFLETHISTRETRNLMKAIHVNKKSKELSYYSSIRGSEDIDVDKKKQISHD